MAPPFIIRLLLCFARSLDCLFFFICPTLLLLPAQLVFVRLLGGEGNQGFHKRSKNRVLSFITVWEHLTRTWPLPGRDTLEQEQGEISWSCLGMLSRNRTTLVCINLCIYSHFRHMWGGNSKILLITVFKMTYNYLLTIMYQFLVLLNYSEQDQESPSCSSSRLFLPSRPPFLVRYSFLLTYSTRVLCCTCPQVSGITKTFQHGVCTHLSSRDCAQYWYLRLLRILVRRGSASTCLDSYFAVPLLYFCTSSIWSTVRLKFRKSIFGHNF